MIGILLLASKQKPHCDKPIKLHFVSFSCCCGDRASCGVAGAEMKMVYFHFRELKTTETQGYDYIHTNTDTYVHTHTRTHMGFHSRNNESITKPIPFRQTSQGFSSWTYRQLSLITVHGLHIVRVTRHHYGGWQEGERYPKHATRAAKGLLKVEVCSVSLGEQEAAYEGPLVYRKGKICERFELLL